MNPLDGPEYRQTRLEIQDFPYCFANFDESMFMLLFLPSRMKGGSALRGARTTPFVLGQQTAEACLTFVKLRSVRMANSQRGKCPKCGSRYRSRAHWHGRLERLLLKVFHFRPYRCFTCDARYYDLKMGTQRMHTSERKFTA